MSPINETHDRALASWLDAANAPEAAFPIQNLPFGVFRRRGGGESWRGGIAIGDAVVDLAALVASGAIAGTPGDALAHAAAPGLNGFMALGPAAWASLRLALSRALRRGAREQSALGACLVRQSEIELTLPAAIGDYTDFYASIHHATNVGRLMRPDQPLYPNYKWLPIGYHGRASSIAVSGQDVARPLGQTMPRGATTPVFGPSRRLDYELEVGVFVGPGNALGDRIALDAAPAHVFGLCLLNDWSARDIQGWEYQPLGPFLAKSFATTISPWIVTLEALAPFRTAWTRPAEDPAPLPYLDSSAHRAAGALDVGLEVWLQTAAMRAAGAPGVRLSSSNLRDSYWSIFQMLAHHSVNGCNMRPGDLYATGTQSGPAPEQAGSLIELTQAGKVAVDLGNGETRGFLQDGDRVTLRARAARDGFAGIGFGDCSGTVLPARA
ncbi:MAG: fumarylacetoacetase [Alphaproteobacteria bacterium]|nr:fumarylacetoacetase [Alphaproteobacteria bacterium]